MRDWPLPQQFDAAHGRIAWREAGSGPALVLLHGIGGGALSWQAQLEALSAGRRVIAWDAPGSGASDPLPETQPLAADYVRVLADWLARLGVQQLALVGHSLGALMAAAFAAEFPQAVSRLVLASPARGYGRETAERQQAKWQERTGLLARLGAERLAAERSTGLCAPGAAPAVIEHVRWNMARITPAGYSQAAHLLAHDDIHPHLAQVQAPWRVLCGALDSVTPPDACEALARQFGAPFTLLPAAGHACYAEQPAAFNRALAEALDG